MILVKHIQIWFGFHFGVIKLTVLSANKRPRFKISKQTNKHTNAENRIECRVAQEWVWIRTCRSKHSSLVLTSDKKMQQSVFGVRPVHVSVCVSLQRRNLWPLSRYQRVITYSSSNSDKHTFRFDSTLQGCICKKNQ